MTDNDKLRKNEYFYNKGFSDGFKEGYNKAFNEFKSTMEKMFYEPRIMFCYKCKCVSSFIPCCLICGNSVEENEKNGGEV